MNLTEAYSNHDTGFNLRKIYNNRSFSRIKIKASMLDRVSYISYATCSNFLKFNLMKM